MFKNICASIEAFVNAFMVSYKATRVLNAKKRVVKVNGSRVFIEWTTVAQQMSMVVASRHEELKTAMFTSGGAMVTHITPEIISSAIRSKDLTFIAKLMFAIKVKPGHYVSLVEEYVNILKPAEVEAIIQHEVGHVHAGYGKKDTPQVNGIYINLEDEMAADRYAASVVGADVLHDALIKLAGNRWMMASAKLAERGFDTTTMIKNDLNDDMVKPRLRALRRMM